MTFRKVNVETGKTINLEMNLSVKDLAYYDIQNKKWEVERGEYKIMVGSSSRDIRQTGSIIIN